MRKLRMVYAWQLSAHGLRMVYAGLRMVYAWFTHGLRMVYAWFTHGFRKVYAWFTHGLRMVYAKQLMFTHVDSFVSKDLSMIRMFTLLRLFHGILT